MKELLSKSDLTDASMQCNCTKVKLAIPFACRSKTSGSAEFSSSVIGSIHNEFNVYLWCTGMFKYIGIQNLECKTSVRLSQHDSVSSLREIPMDSKRPQLSWKS